MAPSSWSQRLRLVPKDELWVGIALALTIYVFERNVGFFFFPLAPLYQHLGSEYYNIAIALVDGRGFSDPFAEITGPTAWMPPLFPTLLAGLLFVLRERALVAEVIVAFSVLSLTIVGVMLYRLAKRTCQQLPPLTIVGLYVVWLWSFCFWFFFITHDIWLLVLLVACIVTGIERIVAEENVHRRSWGILGGTAALASPAVAFAWLATSAFVFLRVRTQRKHMLVAVAIGSCMAAPWLARNAIVFHEFIPSKSNLAFEAYQANFRYEDGVYDNTWNDHPNDSAKVRFRYTQIGEVAFIAEHKERFVAALKADPWRYLRNVYNRAIAITLVPPPGTEDTPAKMAMRRWVYPLPILGLLFGLALRGRQFATLLGVGFFAVSYLLPYTVVAFYLRYIVSVVPCLMFLVFLGADQVAFAAVRRWRPRPPEGATSAVNPFVRR